MHNELKEQERGGTPTWGMGAILIGVGIIMVFGNLTGFGIDNWWVLFMAIPLFGFVANIWHDMQANSRLTSRSTGSVIAGLAVLATAATFLIDGISWGTLWPLAFVFGGLTLLLNNR